VGPRMRGVGGGGVVIVHAVGNTSSASPSSGPHTSRMIVAANPGGMPKG
jgi:hypothetical protein